ncbi:zinc ABC transporter substrate-binding protein [Paenibacillus phoenicis]|uniref:Zinc ABC transporter substrate-binding protein n=1 Tax=Paenibacillus phoenicis TaxID=554117 RepID=A0ABU5PMF1_9BACL|nr:MULTISPECIES: zinc ABC transporter substrate-binding protein [Paenibacillus]EES73284.1 ABC transporter, substrate-binding protein [Paenibacillus sp. oral taxon 786 str. D14]MEA3570987.1 zinc ABC transporter substrate-binding protein [Paenibacillus phoenicis]
MDEMRIKKSPFERAKMTLGVLALIVLAACSKVEGQADHVRASANDSPVKVVATIGMITDVVQEVGGEQVEVTGLMGPGVDPHLYKASQGDIEKLDKAEVVFYGGLHLEGKMTEIFEKLEQKKRTVAVSKDIDPSELRSGADAGGTQYDPHIWFNVRHWITATQTIRDTLSAYDPDHADVYRKNAEAYIAELEKLDAEVKERIAEIPEQDRVLVTAHDAFGYFGDAYGIQVMGLQGISTAAEYGSKDVAKLRDFLVENKIKAVFVESSIPTKSMEAVIAGAAELGHTVKIGGELYSDSLGEPGSEADTYIEMVRHNVNTIVEALK